MYNLSEIGNAFPLVGLAEPRIEPEIVFKLAVAPTLGMGEGALLESIDWVAHGFENDAALKKAKGEDNFFLFGLTVQQLTELRSRGYRPRDYYDQNWSRRRPSSQRGELVALSFGNSLV